MFMVVLGGEMRDSSDSTLKEGMHEECIKAATAYPQSSSAVNENHPDSAASEEWERREGFWMRSDGTLAPLYHLDQGMIPFGDDWAALVVMPDGVTLCLAHPERHANGIYSAVPTGNGDRGTWIGSATGNLGLEGERQSSSMRGSGQNTPLFPRSSGAEPAESPSHHFSPGAVQLVNVRSTGRSDGPVRGDAVATVTSAGPVRATAGALTEGRQWERDIRSRELSPRTSARMSPASPSGVGAVGGLRPPSGGSGNPWADGMEERLPGSP